MTNENHISSYKLMKYDLGLFVLTWFNLNPGMDE